MTDKRVLHVLASNGRRGAEIFATDLAQVLESHGWHSSVVAVARSASSKTLDITVLGDRLTPRTIWSLRRLMGVHDVTIAHGSTALPACALAAGPSRPFVYRSIGDPAYWSARGVRKCRTDLLLRRARWIVALWDDAAQTLVARGIDPARVVVIPNGVDASAFPPVSPGERAEARRTLKIDHGARVVLYLGALSLEKGPSVAVQLARTRPDLVVCIVGDGPMLAETRTAATSLPNLRVEGPTDTPTTYLAAADALFLPSQTEGMPAAAIEAQLRGLPVVATDVGGLPSIVDHAITGFLVPPHDDAGLLAAVDTADTLDPVALEQRRRLLVERFGIDSTASSWSELLTTAADRG